MDTHRLQHGGFIALLVLALAPAARTTDLNADSDLNPDSADTFRSMMSDATARMHAAMHVPRRCTCPSPAMLTVTSHA